jgi:hypothetical protein
MSKEGQLNSPRPEALTPLPEQRLRKVVGVWAMIFPGVKMSRSIETAGEKYFLVSRVVDEAGIRIGEDSGFLLEKISETEFHGTGRNQSIYRVTAAGHLESYIRGESEPTMRGVPCTALWPE